MTVTAIPAPAPGTCRPPRRERAALADRVHRVPAGRQRLLRRPRLRRREERAARAGGPGDGGRRGAARRADARRGSDRRPLRAAPGGDRQRRAALRAHPVRGRRPGAQLSRAVAAGGASPSSSASWTRCSCPRWAPCRPGWSPPDQLARLQGMRALAVRCGNVAGPPLGGLAMGLGGAGAAFALAGGLFAVSVPLLVGTRIGRLPAPARGPRPRPSARPGARRRPARPRRPPSRAPPGPNCATGCATSAGTRWSDRSCCPGRSARSAWSGRSTSGWCCSPRTAAGARPATAGSSRRSAPAPGRARCC